MATPENDNTLEGMSCNTALSDRLTELLRIAREANGLGDAREPLDNSLAHQEQKADTVSEVEEAKRKLSGRNSLSGIGSEMRTSNVAAVATGSPMERKQDGTASKLSPMKSPNTPPRLLNPSASVYIPGFAQFAPVPAPAHLTAGALQMSRSFYDAQLRKAYDEGMKLGQNVGKYRGFTEGFEEGRKLGNIEAKLQKY